ncbi:uncharacterized protein PG998_000225 [Apiospora kogelbergensis]|uniref:uncharacterized protein n=1 Tax=Apiospora kogelbergensis TaxID=1337665 RepID=UPI00312EBD7C
MLDEEEKEGDANSFTAHAFNIFHETIFNEIEENLRRNTCYEIEKNGIELPWDAIAHRLELGTSGDAIKQALARLHQTVLAEGHMVPPEAGVKDNWTRGFTRVYPDSFDDLKWSVRQLKAGRTSPKPQDRTEGRWYLRCGSQLAADEYWLKFPDQIPPHEEANQRPHKKEEVDQKIESMLFRSRNQRELHGENEGDIDKPHDAWFHLSSTQDSNFGLLKRAMPGIERRGFLQTHGTGFEETYAAVVKSSSYRVLFGVSTKPPCRAHAQLSPESTSNQKGGGFMEIDQIDAVIEQAGYQAVDIQGHDITLHRRE